MSRKLLVFVLSELDAVRVICGQCRGVIEMTVDRTRAKFETHSNCPLCNQPLFGAARGADNPLHRLMSAIRSMHEHKTTVDVEFVQPDESDEKKNTGKK